MEHKISITIFKQKCFFLQLSISFNLDFLSMQHKKNEKRNRGEENLLRSREAQILGLIRSM